MVSNVIDVYLCMIGMCDFECRDVVSFFFFLCVCFFVLFRLVVSYALCTIVFVVYMYTCFVGYVMYHV